MIRSLLVHTFLGGPLREGSVVLDFGGNRGEFALEILSRYPVRVVSLEPLPELVAVFPKHERLLLLPWAVSAEDGNLTLHRPENLCATTLSGVHDPEKDVLVPCRSFVSILKEAGSAPVSLLKVDIEGEELPFFENLQTEDFSVVEQCAVEFHDFLYPELTPRVEALKKKISWWGYYCIPFSRNNGDVLFVRKDIISFPTYLYLRYVVRNVLGVSRILKRIFS